MQTNNKLRESMAQVKELARTIYSTSEKGSHHEDLADKIVEIANAALATPLRNCEVGTAEEQGERLFKFCTNTFKRGECPLSMDCDECVLAWAQMPYEEGGEKC